VDAATRTRNTVRLQVPWRQGLGREKNTLKIIYLGFISIIRLDCLLERNCLNSFLPALRTALHSPPPQSPRRRAAMQALASTSATAAFRDALSARSVASRARSAHSRSGEANSAPCSSIASHVSPNLNVLRGPRRWGPLAAASAAYTETWSNPRGAALTQIVEGQVWAAERPFMWNSIDVGGGGLTRVFSRSRAQESTKLDDSLGSLPSPLRHRNLAP